MTGNDRAVNELHCTTIELHELHPCCLGYFVCLFWIFFGNHLLPLQQNRSSGKCPWGNMERSGVCKSGMREM